jgi:hypothetical protein
MKIMRRTFRLAALCLLTAVSASAQIVYHDASAFPLLGKATDSTLTRYERLPADYQSVSRKPLWNLGRQSAGLAVRFRTNSTRIAARWSVRSNAALNHMTPTAVKGLDLYALQPDGKWHFAGSGRPGGQENKAVIIENMNGEMREYMLYLSLYDGVTALEIGVEPPAVIEQPAVELPARGNPIVFYGSSILQGGCASRPGMAHTNILERWLNRECINLGFSGNALLDLEIARLMAAVPHPAMYILDFVPNANVQQMNERAAQFYAILRQRHPDVPILFIEDPIFTTTPYDQRLAKEVAEKNKAIASIFSALRKQGEKHIYYLSSRDMIGHDGEATVDGIHFTDLGFMRYAQLLYPLIKKLL